MTNLSPKRPGGRSNRVKTAVFDAVEALLAEKQGEFPSMGEIAERAGVNTTSLYRRWGDTRNLLADVAIERLMRDQPIPDIGSVRDDLVAWAISIACATGNPGGLQLLRVMALDSHTAQQETEIMKTPIGRRTQCWTVVISEVRWYRQCRTSLRSCWRRFTCTRYSWARSTSRRGSRGWWIARSCLLKIRISKRK